MALDKDLHRADSESKEVWANLHAWRTLGQLRAHSAIEPLLELLHRIDGYDDDWTAEELPKVYGMIGPTAIPALARSLADSSQGLWARVGTQRALEEIGTCHTDSRAECVSAIAKQLERFSENDPTLNGMLIASLLDLNAVESVPVIERAFAPKRVDESVAGDWEDVQIDLGLKKQRTTPARSLWDRTMERGQPPQKIVPPVEPWVNDLIAQMTFKGELKPPSERKANKKK